MSSRIHILISEIKRSIPAHIGDTESNTEFKEPQVE